MPYLTWLVSLVIVAANLRFELRLVHVRCDTGTGLSPALQFSLVSILPLLHTNLNTTLITRTNG